LAQEAERLARLKLDHAERLRRLRRAAYREERPARMRRAAATVGPLADWLPGAEQAIAMCHGAVADALASAGDDESAAILRSVGVMPRGASPGTATPADLDLTDTDSIHLLTLAQKPLERLIEDLEALLDRGPDEATYRKAQEYLERAVRRLGAIKNRAAALARAEEARDLPPRTQALTTRASWPRP
jgi:hypothetical protein